MPIDHYKVSMEARPLKLLYSKYATQVPLLPGSVRPLGSVRRGGSPVHDDRVLSLLKLECEVSKSERVERYLAMSGENLMADMYGSKRSLHSVSDKSEDRTQTNIRARSKSFENKYKLALSRGNQDKKVSKLYSKRVIQLPMLKINLETYVGESEDSKALESTRRSLRNILDVSSKPGHVNGLRQASITQYQFKTPGEMQREALQLAKHQTCSEHYRKHVEHTEQMSEGQTSYPDQSLTLESDDEYHTTSLTSGTLREDDGLYEIDEDEWDGEGSDGYDIDNSSVVAQRLSSAATLGTSYRHLDFETFSSDADESVSKDVTYRSRGDMDSVDLDHFNEYPPKWPSFEDARNMRSENGAFGLSIKPRRGKDGRLMERGSSIIMKKDPPDSFVIRNGVVPKFRISRLHQHSLKPRRKLDPMAPQPHSAHDCPMCNLFKVKEPTPCPPNTPRHPDEIIPDILLTINPDCLREGGMATVGDEVYGEGEGEGEESDQSDIVFRRRHQLMNYDINATPRLGPIPTASVVDPRGSIADSTGTFVDPRGTFVDPKGTFVDPTGTFVDRSGSVVGDHRFGYICPKTAT